MLAPVTASNSWFLSFLWDTTLFLTAASFVALTLIFFIRLAQDQKKSKDDWLRKKLSHYLFVITEVDTKITKKVLPPLSEREKFLFVAVALDILRNVEGSNQERIAKALKLWGMDDFLVTHIDQIAKGRQVQYLTLLSIFKDKSLLPIFEHYAKHRDPYIQIAALRALTKYGVPLKRIETILSSLAVTNQTNTILLTEILKGFGDKATPVLRKLAKNANLTEIRNACIMTLGSNRCIEAVPFLIKLLKEDDPTIQSHTALALGLIGDTRAGDALIPCLSHKNLGVRVQATHALGRLHHRPAIKELVEGLSDQSWWLRYRSAEAIYHMGDIGVMLLRTLSNENGVSTRACQHYLAEKGEMVNG